jgi:outer membrane protein OmpA-like peptidoglycan-associated protein
MRNGIRIAGAFSLLVSLAACTSLPERVETLEEARALIQALEQDPLLREVAAARFDAAQAALARAEENYEDNEPLELIEHDAYLALRNAQIVEQQIQEQRARDELQQGEAERNRVLLQAREQEAQRAQQLAQQRSTELEQRETQLEQRTQELEQQTVVAQEAEQRAQELEQAAAELEAQFAALEAEQTERGLVVTLDDVLFSVDETALQPGAATTLQRIAQALDENPDRNILIEGHTDSTGDASYNRNLSERRAEAVRSALVDQGVDPSRVATRGLGESFPIAANDTPAGRQLNRRVEIVLSDQAGEFPAAANRTASADEQDDSTVR